MDDKQLVSDVTQALSKYAVVLQGNNNTVQLHSGMPSGCSNVIAIFPGGRAAFIECRPAGCSLQTDKAIFLERMRAMGCMCGVARSVRDAELIVGLGEITHIAQEEM